MQDPRDDDANDSLTGAGPAPTGDALPTPTSWSEAGAVRRERYLAAGTDEAWALLQDADGLASWLADDVDLIVAPGERGTLRDADGEERAIVVDEVDPGRRLSLRWWTVDGDETLVDLVLGDAEDGTRFVVTELPRRALRVPDAVPHSWTMPGESGDTGWAPQAAALACR